MQSHRPHPPGKTKTALRRGHFTPGHPAARKDTALSVNRAITWAEQAMLFTDAASQEPVHSDRDED